MSSLSPPLPLSNFPPSPIPMEEVIDLTRPEKHKGYETCPICLNESDCIWQLPCDPRHQICIQCVGPLEKAAADNGQVMKCPFCRKPIDDDEEQEQEQQEEYAFEIHADEIHDDETQRIFNGIHRLIHIQQYFSPHITEQQIQPFLRILCTQYQQHLQHLQLQSS